jgi:twinkle protein
MGRIVTRNQPCKKCPSSDAAQEYENGWTHCFSCGANYLTSGEFEGQELMKKEHLSLKEIEVLPIRGMKDRMLTAAVCQQAGVRASIGSNGEPVKFFFPFHNEKGAIVGYKVKVPGDKKATRVVGDANQIFGLAPFRSGGKRIILTEGEEDKLAVDQANALYYSGDHYPVVSVGSATGANKLCMEERETLRRYDEIILWFDNDDPGRKAAAEVAKTLGYDKVKIARCEAKDANDRLREVGLSREGAQKLLRAVWDAKPYSPASIVSGSDTWEQFEEFLDMEFLPWPPFLPQLNQKTFGRALGTITMFVAGTGVGKSSLLREDIHHIWKTTNLKIGLCFLEEDIGETVSGLLSIHMNQRIGLPNSKVTRAEKKAAWDELMNNDRFLLIDHQGSVGDGSLLDKLEYLVLSGCQVIYLDHITIAVSESQENDTNKAIDIFMSGLLKLVKRHKKVWIGVVSHLRKVSAGSESFEKGAEISEDDLKGSGSLKQISFQTIAIERDKYAEDPRERHISNLRLLKDRKTGESGPAGSYRFNGDNGRLEYVEITKEEDIFELVPNLPIEEAL